MLTLPQSCATTGLTYWLMTEPRRLHDRLMLKANASSLPCTTGSHKIRQRHNLHIELQVT